MNVLVAVDAQLFQTPDGKVWAETIYGYAFWKRYLDVFDSVSVVARLARVAYQDVDGFLRSDGDRVRFMALPMARGAREYLRNVLAFARSAKLAAGDEACAIIRLPSVAASFVAHSFTRLGRPYCIEVVADPSSAFAEHRFTRKLTTWHLKKMALKANGVSYVTQFALQREYPSFAHTHGSDEARFESYYSSIVLSQSFFSAPRDYSTHGARYRIVHTANNITTNVKGHDVTIRIVRLLRDRGFDVSVRFIGGGTMRSALEEYANSQGVGAWVEFTGALASAEEVRKNLLDGDIFVLPTKAEGLPRSVIEAMAVGLPCLSTPVGGVPELLEEKYLFDPLDAEGFAQKLASLIQRPEELSAMSRRNVEKAREYEESVLRERRTAFYTRLRRLAET